MSVGIKKLLEKWIDPGWRHELSNSVLSTVVLSVAATVGGYLWLTKKPVEPVKPTETQAVSAAAGSTATTRTLDAPSTARIFVSESPFTITAMYRDTTSYQADKLFEVYKAKWLRVTDASIKEMLARSDGGIHVIAAFGESSASSAILSMTFTKNQIDSITHLRKGDRISAVCRIERASFALAGELFLRDCEAVRP